MDKVTERYIVFTYDQYYPCGGWHDKRGVHGTLDEAIDAAKSSSEEYWEVVRIGVTDEGNLTVALVDDGCND